MSLGESGVPEEHFIQILPLKKANAESGVLLEKTIQLGRLIGMGFDGAATFSGDKTELSPHALVANVVVMSFNWLLCKLLMLHQVSSMSTPPW